MTDLYSHLIYHFSNQPPWKSIRQELKAGRFPLISNVHGGSLAFILASLRRDLKRPIVAVTPTNSRAENLYDDLYFLKIDPLMHLPEWDTLPYDMDEPVTQVIAKSWEIMEWLRKSRGRQNSESPIIITSAPALLYKLLSLDDYISPSLEINWGDEIDIEFISERLLDAGYDSYALVESRGEFSVRGGIIDIYPPNFDHPVRIDLFGDEVESIRYFDVQTQRTLKDYHIPEKVFIPPSKIRLLRDNITENEGELTNVLDLFPENTQFVLIDPERSNEELRRFEDIVVRNYQEALGKGSALTPPVPELLFEGSEHIISQMSSPEIIHVNRLGVDGLGGRSAAVRLHIGDYENVKPEMEYYLTLIRQKWHDGHFVVIVCDNDGQIRRFSELLDERGIDSISLMESDEKILPAVFEDLSRLKPVVLCPGELHSGFAAPDCGLIILTDREIFGRYKRAHVYRKIHKGKAISSIDELKRGDFVVHTEHGIGRFLGLRQQTIDGLTVDLLEMLYADGNKLLVPTQNIQYVQKYTAVEGAEPSLDKLGSTRWMQRRRKAQEDIQKMADELLALYAERELAKSHACSIDTVWQNEFEASFLYEETPDQLQAIGETKDDLEKERPADRLVCGDVGFGKTEVAMRAAFKVVQEKKQVAILCPTTILTHQHYRTFTERFADYPFKIDYLSRFKSVSEARKVIKRLKMGEIDIIIGTHRLLSKDVKFSDIGLLIVDEEQRFGVRHKEKIKNLKKSVHVITLTATPIPRTLYLAMSGLRDFSVIYTPPPNRLPIKTKIIHWDKQLIEEAVLRELNRGGQVFFVHNRIHNIQEVVDSLKEIVPKARIHFAHGRMKESELEEVIMGFIDGDFDILVSTTIIENGIDIPNVNTILINRADNYGLAQLYQLRGRVGREAHQAYAYLIVPQGQAITDNAVKRLHAIEEFTELGSGFKIALRDMEIRGTGNILGREQHGTITSIGFELYCNLLQEAIESLKGKRIADKPRAEIRWKVNKYIPQDYIPLETMRVGVYKKLGGASNVQQVNDTADELIDRFGPLPRQVENLMLLTRLQILSQRAGIREIYHGPAGIYFKTDKSFTNLANLWNIIAPKLRIIKDLYVDEDDVICVRTRKELKPRGLLRLAVDFLKSMNIADGDIALDDNVAES